MPDCDGVVVQQQSHREDIDVVIASRLVDGLTQALREMTNALAWYVGEMKSNRVDTLAHERRLIVCEDALEFEQPFRRSACGIQPW